MYENAKDPKQSRWIPRWHSGKRICLPMQETQEMWVRSLGGEDPLEEGIAITPVLMPGESHGQRSLVGYGP